MLLTTLAQNSPSRKADSATMADASSNRSLVERLQVLKTAWRLGNGGVPQPWFKLAGSKKVLISKLHSGFAAFAAKPSVALPVGFQDALAEKSDFGNNMTRLGLDAKKIKERRH